MEDTKQKGQGAKERRLAFAERCFIAGCEAASQDVTYDYAVKRWGESLLKRDLETKCSLPPPGWECTREAGHEGPCAAVPVKAKGVTEAVVVANEFGDALEAIAAIFGLQCTAPEMVKRLEDVAKELSTLRIWKHDAIIEMRKHERMLRDLSGRGETPGPEAPAP